MTVLQVGDGGPGRLAARLHRRLRRGRAVRRGVSPSTVQEALLELARKGPARLEQGSPAGGSSLRLAAIIPSFRRGSGGHATIVHLLEGLRARGHEVSVWLEDCEGRHTDEQPELTTRSFREFFGAEGLVLQTDFADWGGADLVVATGWQTVPRALLLEGLSGRAYLVQDHEPEFYGTSAESLWAAWTYRQGLHCIAASPWLAGLLGQRYAASATHFDLGVDHGVYRADPSGGDERSGESVAFYARALTPRRAVPLGLLALEELKRRRADVEIVLFGEDRPLDVPFAHRNLGVLDEADLSSLYRRASLGMVLSLTNPSLIGLQMMACRLACVELASEPMVSTFGRQSPLILAEPDPLALADALEEQLVNPAQREAIGEAGQALVAARTWEAAVDQVEQGLQAALGDARSVN